MTGRGWNIPLGILFVFLAFVAPIWAQQTSIDDLSMEIDALRLSIRAMQMDVQEIKSVLQKSSEVTTPQPTSPPNLLLNVNYHPIIGENRAKVVLIEFSDYQ
jgi:hypothetical protein